MHSLEEHTPHGLGNHAVIITEPNVERADDEGERICWKICTMWDSPTLMSSMTGVGWGQIPVSSRSTPARDEVIIM